MDMDGVRKEIALITPMNTPLQLKEGTINIIKNSLL